MNIEHGQLEPDETPLGDRLRSLRLERGLSLRELAEQIGVTATALHAWERGRRNPKHKHLRAFAAAFHLSERELVIGSEPVLVEEAFGNAIGSPRANELARVIAASKRRIAAAAGISTERIKIIIDF